MARCLGKHIVHLWLSSFYLIIAYVVCSHYPYLDLLVATEAQAMISFTATKNLFTCLWLLLVSFMLTNYFHFQD